MGGGPLLDERGDFVDAVLCRLLIRSNARLLKLPIVKLCTVLASFLEKSGMRRAKFRH